MLETDAQTGNKGFAGLEGIGNEPIKTAAADFEYSHVLLDEMRSIMSTVNIVGLDLDKIWLAGGKVPVFPPEHAFAGQLDIEQLKERSPETIEIIKILNDMELRGTAVVTLTGKSWTAMLLADLQRRMLFEEAGRRGMLEKPYVAEPGTAGVLFSSEIVIAERFKDPKTGRMRAIDEFGNPTDRLVLGMWGFDNGGARREFNHPNGIWETDHFPREFYKTLLRDDVVDLLRDSTRGSKMDRQGSIYKFYYDRPDPESPDLQKDIAEMNEQELWQLLTLKVFKFSYSSPHKAKYNFEFALNKIIESDELRHRWKTLYQEITDDKSFEIHNIQSLVVAMRKIFQPIASATLNYVDENDSPMGRRLVLDLNPPGVNKLNSYGKMIESFIQIYTDAGLPIPDFINSSATLGDGPDKNDKGFIHLRGGWTNFDGAHEKVKGYPIHNDHILRYFDIQVIEGETLTDTEETLLFLRLTQFCRFGRLLNHLPEKISKKLVIPSVLVSM